MAAFLVAPASLRPPPPTAVGPPAAGRIYRSALPLIMVMGAFFALCALRTTSAEAAWVGAGAGGAGAALIAQLLCLAAGKPALQVLAGSLMLACTVAASLIWRCTPWCSALAGVPLSLAGKQWVPWPVRCSRAAARSWQLRCSAASQLHPPDTGGLLLLQRGAGGACLFSSKRPRAAVLLSKAAFVATVLYCTAVTSICLACTPGVVVPACVTFSLAAAAGAAADTQLLSTLAEVLLPKSVFDALHGAGILPGKGLAGGGPRVGWCVGWMPAGWRHLPKCATACT